MKQLKRISLWRRIAIALCFALAIGAGVAGALIPHKDDAFAAADDYDKLEVTCIIDSLENNVSKDEYEQVKGFLVVRGSKSNVSLGVLTPDQYDLTVVYSTDQADTTKQVATLNITWKENSAVKASVTLPAIDAVARGLIVNVDASKAGTLNPDGYYQLAENHYVFFTDMTAEAVLGHFNASVQYQHISKAIKKNADGNFESLGAGFTLRRLFINNNSFEVGAQNIEFTAIIEKGEGNNKETVTLTQTTSLKFMQRRVVSISASYTPKDLDGEGGNDTIYTYTNLKEYLNVTVTYNDGRKGEGISQGDYNVSTLFPNKKWTLENGSEVTINSNDKGTYAKNIVVTYGADTSISGTVQNAPRITYTRPYQFSSLTGTLSTQTVGKEFDFSGLTLTAIYFPGTTSGWFESSVTQVESMVIPLAELEDKSFMQIIYKNDDGEVIDSSAGLVPEGATNVEITFIYELNGKKIDAKKYSLVNQPDLSSSTMLITGGTANKQHRDNYIAYSSKISIENNSTETGTETYNKPVVDTLSKYLVDVEGKLQTVTLDYRLREALAEAADPTSVLSVSVSDLDGNKIENVWSANVADNSYGFIFNQAGFYHITFTLKNDVWETGSKTVSYDISVQKRQLKPSYVNDNSQVLVGDSLIGILNSLQIGFRNEDNDAAAKEYLPGYTLFMYTGSYSNAFQIGTGVAGGNPTINTASIPEDPGIYRVYITYEGNDYYYGGSSYPNNMLTVSIGDTRETNYARQNLTSLVEWWISQSGETAKLYTYNVYHYNEENVGGHFQGEEITDPTEILHAGLYAVKGTDAQGAPVWGVLVIRGLEYNPQPIESERTNIHYGDTTLSKADFVDDAKKILQNHNMYAELDPDNDFTFFAENGTRLSSVSNVGKYQARFKTKPATGETTADYNTPDIYVNFEIKPHVVTGLTLTAGEDNLTSVEYTGSEITFNLKDADGKWLDIYKDNLIVTMNSATLVNGRNINSAFYFVNGTTDGTVRVAIAGAYKIGVAFNNNVVSADGTDYKEFPINVTQARLTVSIADGKDQIEQEATNSVFALQANKLVFTGVGNDNAGTSASAGFRPSSYKVYATYAGGKLSDEQTNAVPYREAPYYLHLTGISANNYRYPVTSGGLLADFTYMENYTFDFGTADSPNVQAVFELKVQQQVLKPLVRKDGEPANTAVTEIFEAGRAWNMLDYFTTAEPISTYKITVTNTKTNQTVTAIPDGADAGKFNLNAGSYSVNIDSNGTNVWENNGSSVTFSLTVKKQAVTIENIEMIRNTYNGAENTASLGGTSAYWSDLNVKGVTANVLYTAPGATGTDAKKPLTNAFDIANGQFKWTNAGEYFITFSIPASNYYWADSTTKDTDKTDFDNSGAYTTGEQKVAEIARMQITAPALGSARLTQTGTARTLPTALTAGTLTQDGFTITYDVEYATAGALQGGSHNHGDFGTARPANDDSTQGMYAIRLTITGDNATNFAWARNAADIDYISYTNAYDIQGFENNTHVAILHYVTVTQTLDIDYVKSLSFYFGGYLSGEQEGSISDSAMENLADYMFRKTSGTDNIPEGTEFAYSYLDANGNVLRTATATYNGTSYENFQVTGGTKRDFKTWDAGMYVGRVTLTFPNTTEFLPLSFNVAITVNKLPVSLVLSGEEFYGADQGNYLPTVAYAEHSKRFLNADGTEIAEADIPVNFTTAIDKTTSAGTYDAEAFTLNAGEYSKNYEITYTASYTVKKAPITLTVGTGTSEYGATIDYYLMLGDITQLRNEDKIADVVTASVSASDVSYSNGRLHAGEYRVDFTAKEGNYTVTFSGNAYNNWTVEKIQALVQIDISLFYGEVIRTDVTAPATSDGIYTVTYSDMLDGDLVESAGVSGNATFTVSNGNVVYTGGLTSTNYTFADISNHADPNLFGKVSSKPLDVTVAIDNVGGEYYKPKALTYTLTVNSASSYDEGTVLLSDTIKEELGGVEGTDGTYTFAMWSQSLGNYSGKPFILSTGAYENYSGEGEGSTANAGTYAIVGMANPEFANRYAFTFVNGSYEVTKVDGSKFTVTADENYEGKEGEVVIIIKLPGQVKTTTSTEPETRQAAPAKAETVKAEVQKTTTRRATSLAKTVEEEATPTAEGEPELIELESELTYDEEYHTLAAIEPSTIPDGYVPVYLLAGNNEDVPAKSDSRWTSVCPSVIDAGTYTVYIYFKVVNTNYPEISMVRAKVTIKTAKNAIAENGDFKFAKDGIVHSNAASAEGTPAWKYGLYAEGAEDGFNILGDHAITEPVTNFTRGAKTSVSLYKTGETDTLVYTASSATALFTYMFNNGTGERFNAGTYKLVFTVSTDPNAKGQKNFDDVTATYYFSVAKRAVTIAAGDQEVVYGETATGLTATVTGLVRNNYHASEKAINPTDLYTLAVSGYTVGDDVGTMGTVTVTLADNIDELLGNNYIVPTADSGLSSGTLTVSPRRVAVQIVDKSSIYGDAEPTNTFDFKYVTETAYDNVYEPYNSQDPVALKVQSPITSTTDAGTYPIYAVWNKISESSTDTYEKNYEVVFVNCSYGEAFTASDAIGEGKANTAGTYTVNKKIINVIWDGESGDSFVYNGKSLTFTAKAEGIEQIDSNPVLIISYAMKDKANGEFKPLTNGAKPTDAGEYKISAEFNSEKYPNYTTGGSSITITITKATATVTVGNVSVQYGEAFTTGSGMTFSFPAFATQDDKKEAADKWEALTDSKYFKAYTDRIGDVLYKAGTIVGNYRVTINTTETPSDTVANVELKNFNLQVNPGVFTVTKRNVTVIVGNLSKVYSGKYVTQAEINALVAEVLGNLDQTLYILAEGSTLGGDDTFADLGIVLSVENALNAIEGGYTITPSSSSENYNVVFDSVGKLLITKKALTVSASATVVYGEELTADKVEFAFGKFVDGKEVNNFVKGEDYASLLAISNAMGADAANNPIIGQLTSNYSNCGYSAGVPVSNKNLTITPSAVEGNDVFLNYDIKEFVAGAITILRKPITATGKAVTYNQNGYEGIVFADIAGVRAEDAEAFKVVYDLSNLMNEGKSVDCGTYSVTVTLESSEAADPPIAQNYTFGDSNSDPVTNTTVSIEIVQQVIHVGWDTDSYTVDFSDGVAHTVYLDEKFANGFNTLFTVASFVRNFYNEDERVWDTQEDIDIITGSDGRCYFVINDTSSAKVNGIGEYVLTLQLKDSINYRWQNPVSAGSDKYQLISINATTNKVTVGITANDVEYTKPLDIEVTVDVGSVRNVTYIYFTNDSQDAETQYNALKALATIDNAALEQYGFTQIDATVTPEPVNAGYYVVLAQYVSSDGSRSGSAYAAFEIKPLAVSAPVVHGVASLDYNGSAQVFEVTGFESYMTFAVPDGMTYTLVGNDVIRFTATDAETYAVTFSLEEDPNHVWKEGEQTAISFTVEKSEQVITLDDVYTFAYGEEIRIVPALKFASDDTVLLFYEYGNPDAPQGGYLGSAFPSTAGVYYAVVSDNGTDNYERASKGAVVVIEKKEVKVSVTVNVPYGQTVTSGDIHYTLTGFANGETENDCVTVNLSALASGITFGEGTGLRNAGRYQPSFATVQTVINAFTGSTANGLVGFGKRGAADNYYFTADENSIVIVNKLAVSVVIGSASGTFGSSPQYNSGLTLRWADSIGNNSIPSADRAKQDAELMELLGVTAGSFYCTAKDTSDVGSYPIQIRGSGSNDNYNVTFVDGSYEVLPANIFVEWTVGGGTYGNIVYPEITKLSVLLGGSLQDVTNSAFGQNAISKLSFLFTDLTGNELFEAGQHPLDAGEYYAELVLNADGKLGKNYILSPSSSAQRRFSVSKLVIEVEDVRVDYGDDGMKLAYKNGEAVVPTLVANEELNGYFTISRYDDARTVGTYFMTLTINEFRNVQWSVGRTADYRLAFNVTKAKNHIVGSIQMEGWTYGEEAKIPSVTLANDKDVSDGVEIVPVFEYSANNGADWTTVVPTEAGSYLVRATANGTTNVDSFASPSATPFIIARKSISKPKIEVNVDNNTYTGSVLLANVSGFDQRIMMFDYVGNFTVDGNSIALTALNAGTYALTITLTNSNYIWEDSDENLVYEQVWTVAPKRLEKPTGGKNSFVVNGGIIAYTPENFDPETMNITGNEEGHGGTFTAEITLKDPANYIWDDGTADAIQIEWTIVGINTVYKALMGVLGSIAGLAVIGGAAQFVLNKRKQKREAEGLEGQTEEKSEGGEQA